MAYTRAVPNRLRAQVLRTKEGGFGALETGAIEAAAKARVCFWCADHRDLVRTRTPWGSWRLLCRDKDACWRRRMNPGKGN